DLPPVGHSPSETSPLPPDRQYVLELVEGALRWNDSHAKDLGDLKLRSISDPSVPPTLLTDEQVISPPFKPLPGFVRPLYVVVPCRVEDDDEEVDLARDDDGMP